ncbi:dihydropteroate synthase [Marinagarivorans algicola]|uniref:dihydropteroate synthase n=1 Tax=Marinagarivorans algicola TaxID=1513270 RepID=UPI0031402C0C
MSEPQVMGILNVTPDSFSDGAALHSEGRLNAEKALIKAAQMVKEGASIIDVGGESTRPGASRVHVEQELERVLPVIELIHKNLDVVISVDTSQPLVMKAAAAAGAGLINDVRALQLEGAMAAAVGTRLPVCLMHMQGDPQTMQHNPEYADCTKEVYTFLYSRLKACCDAGMPSEQVLLDPGIGFGKKDEHNLELIKHLQIFTDLGAGVLFGASRKSMVGRLLGREVHERLSGSLALALVALQQGAKILRVHDVAATVDVVKVYQLTHAK